MPLLRTSRAELLRVALAFAAAAAPATADTLRLKNNQLVKGKILGETDNEVRIEVENGGIRAQMTFARADVESIQQEDDPRLLYERKMADAESIADVRRRGEAYLAVGHWAVGAGLIDAACAAFERCASVCPALQEVADFDVAQARFAQRGYAACAECLRRILERNPNHEQAKALLRKLEETVGKDLDADLVPALDLYRKGDCRGALVKLENIVRRYDRGALDHLSQQCEKQLSVSLAGILVDCRFRQGCPNNGCKGGSVECPKCEGGSTKKFNREVIGFGDRPLNASLTYELCGACKGIGYQLCKKCLGLGIYFGQVTEYEREELVKTLLNQVKRLGAQSTPTAEEAVETVGADGRTTTLKRVRPDNRTLNEGKILSSLLLARRYLAEAIKVAPALAAPAGADLRGDLQYVENLIATLLSRKTDLYMAGALSALTTAVGQLMEGAAGGRFDLFMLRRSLEEAARARRLMEMILALDPTSRGVLSDDSERRRQLIDQFLRAASELMQTAATDKAGEQLPRAARRAVTAATQIVEQLARLSESEGYAVALDHAKRALGKSNGPVEAEARLKVKSGRRDGDKAAERWEERGARP